MEYVKVGNIIKRKRPGDEGLPSYERKNFSPMSLLHNDRRDGGEAHRVDRVDPSPPTNLPEEYVAELRESYKPGYFEKRILGRWEDER